MASRVTDGWLAKLRGKIYPLPWPFKGRGVRAEIPLTALLQHEAQGGAATWSWTSLFTARVGLVVTDLKPEQVRLPRFLIPGREAPAGSVEEAR
jgi:hypothetical protein